MSTKKAHGGARRGAGRKPGGPRGANVTFYAPADLAPALLALPAGQRAAYLVELVRKFPPPTIDQPA